VTLYLLDTNAVVSLLRNSVSNIAQRLRRERPADVAISSIVAHELFYGAYRSARPAHYLALVEALRFEVMEFDTEDAQQAGRIWALLAERGSPIGPYDILIAGQAAARGLTLVTHNRAEFQRAPGLKCEDWEIAPA